MIVTTSLVALQMHYVKGLPVIAGIAFFIFFTFIDGETFTRAHFMFRKLILTLEFFPHQASFGERPFVK
jgi:hypothetical protein